MDTEKEQLNKRRRATRELLMQLVYQMDMTGDFSDAARKKFLDEHSGEISVSEPDFKYFNTYLAAVRENYAAIDERIASASDNWKLSRIAKVDLAILRLSVAEMTSPGDKNPIPHRVSINEAVELAKKYAGDNSPGFVNGILGKIECSLSKSAN
ncbi:MAG: transcription antitermination factor NusB [Clostridiales Family XIII bacterium]|jgi:N utilization substance protein B|nr:transcription antitermination factor NusB [Clostridiales Family XIII bacterium]